MPNTETKPMASRTRVRISSLIAVLVALTAGVFLLSKSSADRAAETDPLIVQATETEDVPATLNDLAERSELVVLGEVVSVQLGRILDTPEDETPVGSVDVVLDISQVLHGATSADSIVIGMLGGEISSDGETIGRQFVVNGVRTPPVGTEMVWFVFKMEGNVGAAQRYGLVSFDGFFIVNDGILQSQLDEESRLGPRTTGLTVEDLVTAISP